MRAPASRLDRPAFYALPAGGWRDLVTLLHPPYTAWHLSYVVLGAAVAPVVHLDRMGAALGAFALAVGVAAHALDELHSRPLGTRLGDRTLVALAVAGLAGALGIGIGGVVTVSTTLVPLVVAGGLLVVAYNLEVWGGRLHGDGWFAAAWGAFPAFAGFWSSALRITAAGLLVTAACFVLSAAQRRLSTPVRTLRRRTVAVSGEQRLADGRTVELDADRLAAPLDGALRWLSLAMPLVATAVLVARL